MDRRKVNKVVTASIDTKPIEEQVYQSDRGGFFFAKGKHNIQLPGMLPYWVVEHKKYYVEIATKIDHTLNKYYDLIGEENLYIRSRSAMNGQKGATTIQHCNASHITFAKDNYSENFVNMAWTDLHIAPSMGTIDYNSYKEITVTTKRDFQSFIEPLLGIRLDQTLEAVEFDTLIEDTIVAIDNLFIEQRIKPTDTSRHNLISLAVSLTKYAPGIQNLIETVPKTHTINNPNLIRLASQGVNDNLLKMFYAYDVYPESVKEMLELVDIPIEMLYGIWNGKR